MTTWLPAFFVLVKMLNYLPRKYTKLTKMYLCSKRLYMGQCRDILVVQIVALGEILTTV